MDEREALRIAIERARIRLEVDRLIENYVSLCEQKELVPIR